MQRFVSNRMEVLVANLAAHLMEDPPDPMEPELIVVQSRGMERWLSMEIAKWSGIASHLHFLFPASLMTRLLRPMKPLSPDEDPWKPDSLRWACFEALAALPDSPDAAPVARYMGDDPLKRFQLADMLADLFDQYLMFRPDRILAWEQGEEDHFQARLWRMLRSRLAAPHRVDLLKQGVETLKHAELPPRISIFGVSALPPLYLEFLEMLSEHVTIRWYLLDPCQEYWGDIRCENFWETLSLRAEDQGLSPEDLHAERGHPLLASLGRTGQDFFRRLATMPGEEQRHALEPGMDTLLHRLQSRILSLDALPEKMLSEEVVENDDSIAVYRCHGPMREMEVLKDQLLRLFSGDTPPRPRDILVMFPDVGAYAPYIDAVFGSPLPDGRRLPYTVSERPLALENTLAGLLMRVIQLMESRFGASEVFDVLEAHPVARKFDLDTTGLERIRFWLVDTRIRWGLDAAFREALDLPATKAHTWRFGLDRMLLGMAMEDEGGSPEKEGILPYDPMGPEAADTLNSLLSFMERLVAFHENIREDRSPQDWMDLLWELVLSLFHEDGENTDAFLGLRTLLDTFVTETRLSGLDGKLPFSLIRSVLGQALEGAGQGGLILGGGITFCAMVPMRCIPFSLICLSGMNDGAFPRTRPRPAFDLMQQQPRAGDRSSRDDDRYLFLETLLSAREKLWITFTGFRPEDDQALPPSVLVQELLDALNGEEGSLPHPMRAFPMQAFSSRLFRTNHPLPAHLFSFSTLFRDLAATFSGKDRPEALPFQDGELENDHMEKTVFWEDVIAFFQNPSAFFLKRHMQISLEREEEALEDRENFTIGGLGRYWIQESFCRTALEDGDMETAQQRLEAQGRLAAGAPGRSRLAGLEADALALADLFHKTPGSHGEEAHPFALELAGIRLEGSLPVPEDGAEKIWRPGKFREKHLIAAWLRFLLHRAMGRKTTLHLVGMGEEGPERKIFACPELSREKALLHLESFMACYRSGLTRPQPFFPSLSRTWAEAVLKNKKTAEIQEHLMDAWEGSEFTPPQSTPADRLLWRGCHPFDPPFPEISETLWLPLLEAMKEKTP